MYDPAQLVHIVGTVKSYQWTNPHVMVWVTRDEPAGELWTIELPTSPGNLARTGWSKTSLVPGDKVDVEINPLRDGQHGGSFKKVTLVESGKVLVASAPGAPDAGASTANKAALPPADCSDAQDEHAAPVKPGSDASDAPVAAANKPKSGCSSLAAHTPSLDVTLVLLAVVLHRRRRPLASAPGR